MKFISINNVSGSSLVNKETPTSPEMAKYRWKNFRKKDKLSKALREDQHGLCAYSEIIPESESLGTHIEHVVPKSVTPERTFDIKNLVVSALSCSDLKQMNKSDYFGGHAKLDRYDETLFISCLDSDCAQYFSYISNGLVEAKKDLTDEGFEKANYTIQLLNLNSPYLVTLRKSWINELDSLIEEYLDDDLPLEELARFNLLPEEGGGLAQFYSATLQRFGPVGEKVLA